MNALLKNRLKTSGGGGVASIPLKRRRVKLHAGKFSSRSKKLKVGYDKRFTVTNILLIKFKWTDICALAMV